MDQNVSLLQIEKSLATLIKQKCKSLNNFVVQVEISLQD